MVRIFKMGVKTNANSKLSFRIVMLFYIFSIFDELLQVLEPGFLYMVMVENNKPPNPPAQELLPALQELNPHPRHNKNLKRGKWRNMQRRMLKNLSILVSYASWRRLIQQRHSAVILQPAKTARTSKSVMDMGRNNCLICRSVVVFYLNFFFS